ncbi:YaaR family protein [Halobacillus amylolyticus]|uniref:YaaR family protein n=1 Tax=Halobacillus amylolyticus TaxID=2932259 RepID=A0ABY4H8D3_9BACI|nr:YaaR family protein [Halobacillus amylolyticus]UOR10708.1 YaaR family protein [Halobacillus amylolyticus]
MKISQDMRTQLEAGKKQPPQQMRGKMDFSNIVQAQSQQLQENQLNQLMKSIAAQGDRVARFRSFRDLAKYKRLIKGFVEESVQYGMNVKHSQSFNMEGHSRKLTIVESVDQKLAELTEAVMDQEKKSIDLLGIIGEIKGLLINLYT